MDEYIGMALDQSTRFGILPVDIKQIILISLLLTPIKALEIIDKCDINIKNNINENNVENNNENNFKKLDGMICGNRSLFETLWLKYVKKNIDEKYKRMIFADFRNETIKRMKLYKKPVYEIKYEDFNGDEDDNLVYKNAKNVSKLQDIIVNDVYNPQKIIKLINNMTYVDQPLYSHTGNLLETACSHNNYDVAKLLIDKGANVTVTPHGERPLEYACQRENLKIVKLLVENGADINYPHKAKGPIISTAIFSENKQIFDYLVKNGADIFAKNNNNATTLMTAASRNNLDIVKYLLKNGLNINDSDDNGNQALSYCTSDNLDIIQYLLDNGADIDHRDQLGMTALMRIIVLHNAKHANFGNAIVLINNGANLFDADGNPVSQYTDDPQLTKFINKKIKKFIIQELHKKGLSDLDIANLLQQM